MSETPTLRLHQKKLLQQRTGRLLTVAALSKALGVKPSTLYYWVEAMGLAPSFRITVRSRMYFLLEDVFTWAKHSASAPSCEQEPQNQEPEEHKPS